MYRINDILAVFLLLFIHITYYHAILYPHFSNFFQKMFKKVWNAFISE